MFASLLCIPRSLLQHHYLVRQLTWRDIAGRYRGSAAGLLWSFLTPLVMLAMYTLVFGVMFKTQWTAAAPDHSTVPANGHVSFALILFVGLILHSFLAECLSRAPGLILGNANLVKRVVFPLEILGWSTIGSALFHGAISFVALFAIYGLVQGAIPWTVVLLPIVVLPLVLLTLGLVWFLASFGVFLRDIGQVMPPVLTLMLFLSPILFPISAIPEALRGFLVLNPLTIPVEQARDLIIWGVLPNWLQLGVYSVVAAIVAAAGLYWFNRSRPAFADVM
ncbi:ABC transporter permease [Azospirillum cavernae]|uniref:Transport permease protein n=1 Tax=Azospirillum cavernae TaxID=2320860 RepID=A0A418VL10_9PROT|nr:ABC transporter permease [Azospirillum cavernae]RJF76822.1 ABC transporter permease [Azospirillum cavernae]